MNELDVQNEWEENTHTHTHTSTAIDFNSRLQKQVRPHLAHVILITDIWSILTYIARAIRPTRRTLYTIPPPMLLSVDRGGVRHHPLVLQTNPSGSGRFTASTSEVVLAATSTRRFPQQSILVLYQVPPSLTFPENLCCSRSAVIRHGHPVNHKMCLTPRQGASRVMTKCNGITFKNNFQ